MMKQCAAMSGMKEDQLAKGVSMFVNMDDKRIDLAISRITTMDNRSENA